MIYLIVTNLKYNKNRQTFSSINYIIKTWKSISDIDKLPACSG